MQVLPPISVSLAGGTAGGPSRWARWHLSSSPSPREMQRCPAQPSASFFLLSRLHYARAPPPVCLFPRASPALLHRDGPGFSPRTPVCKTLPNWHGFLLIDSILSCEDIPGSQRPTKHCQPKEGRGPVDPDPTGTKDVRLQTILQEPEFRTDASLESFSGQLEEYNVE